MTNNEPTVRYWRHDATGSLLTAAHEWVERFYASTGEMTKVHVLTESELEAHTTAACADAWDEGFDGCYRYERGYWSDPRNPYRRTTESEDHRG